MFKRGFTLMEFLVVLAIISIAVVWFAQISEAQEVEPALVGTITSSPNIATHPNSNLNVFRPNTLVGPVVTFGKIDGYPVDWTVMRANRLTAIALEAADNVNFDHNSSDLNYGADEAIVVFARLLVANPDINVTVEGHTDSVGEDDFNFELSLRRAVTVRDALTDVGLGADRIEVIAHGEKSLLLRNALESERIKNRRVEFHLIDGFTGAKIN
jgi:prepilin-type N-terminal cleavage/methylation domain-containing protein